MQPVFILLENLTVEIDFPLFEGGIFWNFVFDHLSEIFFGGNGETDKTNNRFFPRYGNGGLLLLEVMFSDKFVNQVENLYFPLFPLTLGGKWEGSHNPRASSSGRTS